MPDYIWLREASTHDLSSVREQEIRLPTSTLFGDKAYPAPDLAQALKEQETRLLTPLKKLKGGELSETQKSYNRVVNRLRQPIESFFNWLNEKTQIQNAIQRAKRNHPLRREQKLLNRLRSSTRIRVEHTLSRRKK